MQTKDSPLGALRILVEERVNTCGRKGFVGGLRRFWEEARGVKGRGGTESDEEEKVAPCPLDPWSQKTLQELSLFLKKTGEGKKGWQKPRNFFVGRKVKIIENEGSRGQS